MYKLGFTFLLLMILQSATAQIPRGLRQQGRSGNMGNTSNKSKSDTTSKKDKLGFEQRDDAKDSITVTFKYLDSIRSGKLDTSINDFSTYFPLPASYQYLGNNGAAAYSMVFSPFVKPGWDAGFHAFEG